MKSTENNLDHLISNTEIDFWGISLDILKSGIDIKVPLKGTSMFPYLRAGDIAVLTFCDYRNFKKGDIVVFRFHDAFLAHRLIKKEKIDLAYRFITRGDSCDKCDLPFDADCIIGKIKSILRKDKKINIDSRYRSILNFLFASFMFIPLVYLKLYRLLKH